MSPRVFTLRTLAHAACVLAACLVVGFVALVVLLSLDSSYEPVPSLSSSLPDVLTSLVFVLVGVLVTLKRPPNLVGWALLLAGVGLFLGGLLDAYGQLALLAKPEDGLPAGAAAAALAKGSWSPLMAGVFLLLLVFPSGTIPSSAVRRFVVLVLSGFAAVWAISATAGQLDPPFEAYDNPLAVTANGRYIVSDVVSGICVSVSVVLAAIIALRRFRRSRGQERQQFKWLAASAGLLIVTLPFAAAFTWGESPSVQSSLAGAVFTVALTALPASVGIAVLRYRLFEIDRVISKTLVYGSLTAIMGVAYVGLVLLGQAVFSSFAGGSDFAIAVSTLVVAAFFLPVRSRVQRFVDRRFYRRRYDAQRTLEAFGARLREQVELEALVVDLRGVVVETMQPAHVSLWLRGGR
jgi:hypothetical protein